MTPEHPTRRGQRYNRIVTAVFAIGVVSFFVGMAVGQYLLGLVVYAVAGFAGIGALLYLRFFSSARLADERSRRLRERTSDAVVCLWTYVGLPAIIGLYLLDATGYYEISPMVWGGIATYAGLYLTLGVVYAVYWYRS